MFEFILLPLQQSGIETQLTAWGGDNQDNFKYRYCDFCNRRRLFSVFPIHTGK